MSKQGADDSVQLRKRIDRYLHESGLASGNTRVVPLTGDASDRRYFRIIPATGPSLVLALHAGPIDFATLPFASVGELLQRIPLPVPDVLGHADQLGIIALQDLGDVTLQAHLGAESATRHTRLYHEAIEFIVLLQRRGAELASAAGTPYRLAFDVEKLTWELDFFVTHFVEGYRRAVLSPAERAALSDEWKAIAGELAVEPRVLCHRDYHSRNLMVHDGGLFVIDFQDARMGPDTYDLVSLLRDSYVDIGDAELEGLMGHYLSLAGGPDAGEFRRRFDLMAVQRNLKALGTFGNQAGARGNPAYIQYMPRTLAYARANLAKYSRFARLRELLTAHVPELA
jgi:aminoglycoside/choline kinase family phosphotransferase